jgi:hypothetical protein
MKVVSKLLLAALVAAAWPACRTAPGGDPELSTEVCSDACAQIAAVECGDIGESCVSSCVSHPTAQYAASCASELKAYLGCFWKADGFDCDAEARTVPLGCDAELVAYDACLSSSGAGGAGGDRGVAGAAGLADAEP